MAKKKTTAKKTDLTPITEFLAGSSSQVRILFAALMSPGFQGRWGLPVVIEGPPGSAKTSVINSISKLLGMGLHTFLGSLRDPTDLCGVMVPVKGEDGRLRTVYSVPPVVTALENCEAGILFLDELNFASPAMQAAELRALAEGYLGDYRLHSGVRPICAQNSVETGAGRWDLDPAMANRLIHLQWEDPTPEAWMTWAQSRGNAMLPTDEIDEMAVDADAATMRKAYEAHVEDMWPMAWQTASALVSGFLQRFPTLMRQEPKTREESSKAWASPRSWELVMACLAAQQVHQLTNDETYIMVRGAVGEGVGSQLYAWLEQQDVPDAAEVLANPDKAEIDLTRIDKVTTMLWLCSKYVTGNGDADKAKGGKELANMWKLLHRVADVAPDLCLGPVKYLRANKALAGPHREVRLLIGKAATAAGYTA